MRFLSDLLTNAAHCSGTPTSIVWTDVALHRTVAQFSANTDSILYDKGYFPKQGTIGLWVYATSDGYILNSASISPAAGDIRLEMASNNAKFSVYDTGWRAVTGTTSINGTYFWLAVSYGPGGVRLWVNGTSEGTPLPLITQQRAAKDVYLGNYATGTVGCVGHMSDIQVSDVESDPIIILGEDGAMALRLHSYGVDPRYDFDFEYQRAGIWSSLKTRVMSAEPISVDKSVGQFYAGRLVLDNCDGLLTTENLTSAYNLNVDTYDPLFDEARPVRLRHRVLPERELWDNADLAQYQRHNSGCNSRRFGIFD
jgi:hypothetical protein